MINVFSVLFVHQNVWKSDTETFSSISDATGNQVFGCTTRYSPLKATHGVLIVYAS